jgi:hypothetical protein
MNSYLKQAYTKDVEELGVNTYKADIVEFQRFCLEN